MSGLQSRRLPSLVFTLALTLTLTLAFIVDAVPLAAQAKRAPKGTQMRWWRQSWEKALETAVERNVPIVIAVIQDGEEANERLIDGVLKAKEFVAACEGAVTIICSQKDHGNVRQKIAGNAYSVCRRFGATPCDQHQALERRMFRHFFSGKAVETPQVMFCRPDLEVIEFIDDVAGVGSYVAALKRARKAVGPGLDAKSYEEARVSVTKGRNLINAKKYRQAWDVLKPAASIGGRSTVVRKAKRLQEEILRHFDRVVKEAGEAAQRKDHWAAMTALDELRTKFAGTAPGDKAKEMFARLRRTKPGRVIARQLKKQKRYVPMMADAKALEGRNDFLRARRIYQRIVRAIPSLPVGREAKARLDFFAGDPDIKKLMDAADRDDESKALLRDANKLKAGGQTSAARALYERIIKEFPGTAAAKKAKAEI